MVNSAFVKSYEDVGFQGTKTTRLREDALGRKVCEEKELKYFKTYDYPSCQAECLIENMLQRCGCTGKQETNLWIIVAYFIFKISQKR